MSLLSGVLSPLSTPLSRSLAGGLAAGVREAVDGATRLLGVHRRDVWSRPGRCHIDVRGVRGPRGMWSAHSRSIRAWCGHG